MNRFFLTAADVAADAVETVSEAVTEAATEDLGGFMSPERLALAGQVVLIGLGMVFAVLALLWGILALFGKVMTRTKKQTAPAEPVAPVEPAAPVAEEPVADAAATVAETDDGELIAVITAAVAAAIESDEELSSHFASGFRVVSFKKSARSARGH